MDNKYISDKLLGKDDIKWLGVDVDDTMAKKIWPAPGMGEEIPGAIKALAQLQSEGWKICIFSARPWADHIVVEKWCEDHGFQPDKIILGKPLFKVMIDDSAYRFSGDWDTALTEIKQIIGERANT